MRAKIVTIIVSVLVFVVIITSQVVAFTGNMPQYCSDKDWCFDFANDVSFNLADSNGTRLKIEGISGWSENLVVGSGGDINVSSNNKSTIIMYKHNSTYDKFNLSGDGSATVYLSKQADTDFAVYENGAQIDTINSGADGRINFTVTLSENQYVVNTTEVVTATSPVISNVSNTSISPTEQQITWDVNQTTDNRVLYDNDTDLSDGSWSSWNNSTAPASGVSNDVTISLTGLQDNTTYYFQAWSYNSSNSSYSASSSTYSFTTAVQNYIPYINTLTVPVDNDPAINNSYTLNISDQNGLDNVTQVSINFSRSDTGCSAPNDALNHYQVVYDVQNQSITGYPGDYFYLTEGVDTAKTNDSFSIKFKPESHARPSKLTSNSTVNNYVWYVNATITDGNSSTWLNGTTEIKPLTLLDYSSTALTLDAKNKGETYTFSNNPVIDNAGNVWHHINFSMTDLTSASTNDYIGASNCSLDDDATHNETTESGKPEMTYHTYTQTWQVNLTTQRGADPNVSTYNFIYIPWVEDAKYTGTVTYEGVESHAK